MIAGSVDIGVGIGIMGALAAFSKNAPVRVLGAETTGAADLFWYVKADSPIKTLKDTDGKTIAFSGKGSSTDGIVTAFMKQYDLKAKPTATGGPSATLTAVMSGQIDVGWSAPPFGLAQLDKGEIRIIASGNDASVFKGQTVRILAVNAQALESRKAVLDRYMQAYRETIDWMYSDPAAIKLYAEWLKIPESIARRTRDGFFPKAALDPDRIVGLDTIIVDAVALKYTPAPLSKEQLAQLIQNPAAKVITAVMSAKGVSGSVGWAPAPSPLPTRRQRKGNAGHSLCSIRRPAHGQSRATRPLRGKDRFATLPILPSSRHPPTS